MEGSTELSRSFADQGIRIRIRRPMYVCWCICRDAFANDSSASSRMRRRTATDTKDQQPQNSLREEEVSEEEEEEVEDPAMEQPPRKRVAHASHRSVSSSVASGRSTPVYGHSAPGPSAPGPSAPPHPTTSTAGWAEPSDLAVRRSPALAAAYRSVSYPDLRTHPSPLRAPAPYTPPFQPSRNTRPMPPIMAHPSQSVHQGPPPPVSYRSPQHYGQMQGHGHPPHHAPLPPNREHSYSSRDPFHPQHSHAPDHGVASSSSSHYYSYHQHPASLSPAPRLAPLQEPSGQHLSPVESRRPLQPPTAPNWDRDIANHRADRTTQPSQASISSTPAEAPSVQEPPPRPQQARAPKGLMSLLNDSNDDGSPFSFHRSRPPPRPATPPREGSNGTVSANDAPRDEKEEEMAMP
jgi:hypothetical protein